MMPPRRSCCDALEACPTHHTRADRVEILVDFQLMIEHAEELNGRSRVIFVDASTSAVPPFELTPVMACRDRSYTSHQMSPAALIEVQRRAFGTLPGEAWQLAIPATDFGLGRPMSTGTGHCLAKALIALIDLIERPFGKTAPENCNGIPGP
jgi:Ni,Fe-hydrogenase maturation factor